MTFGVSVTGHSNDPEVEAKVRTLTEQFYNGLRASGCRATFSSYGGAGSITDSWSPPPPPPAPPEVPVSEPNATDSLPEAADAV